MKKANTTTIATVFATTTIDITIVTTRDHSSYPRPTTSRHDP